MIMLEEIDYCETCQHCDCEPHLEPCVSCKTKYIGTPTKYLAKRHTNADRIRAMSDEELAKFLADEIPHGDCCGCDLECATFEGDKFENSCHNAYYRWLKQPAEE
jgi:hypothetical protein